MFPHWARVMNVLAAAHVIMLFVAEPGIIASWSGKLETTRNKGSQTIRRAPANVLNCLAILVTYLEDISAA